MERYLAHMLQPLEDHARHPEEEDVVPRLHHIAGVEVVEVGCLFRPAERAERPQARREPRIEHVVVLPYALATALYALGHLLGLQVGGKAVAVLAVPYRYAVAPPQLPRYGPVTDVLHPMEIHFGEPLGHYLNLAFAHHLHGRLGQRLHAHEPLVRHDRLQHSAATLAVGHTMGVRLH